MSHQVEEVPKEVRDLVGTAMTDDGLYIWWLSEHPLLNNRRPMDVWETNQKKVIDFIKSALGGDMA